MKKSQWRFIAAILGLLLFVHAFPVFSENAEIIKPDPDKRSYRSLTLENRMKVTLISDPDAEVSAASLNLRVGSYDNPEDVQGMAHFLEHMLFLGTEKYPDPGEYAGFLETNGGSHNAFTGSSRTNYFFNVDPAKYEEALDRLSQFFIAPLFTEDLVQRELNAINAEHSKNIQNDNRRYFSVLRSLSKTDHPNFMFSTGNDETLKIVPDLRERMIRFYEDRYSANLMHLTLVSRDPLNRLENLARKYYGPVKNRNSERLKYDWDYLDGKNLPGFLKVKTLKEEKTLSFQFILPPYLEHYSEKPWTLLGTLIGDESENSLHHHLTRQNLISSLSAGFHAGEASSHFSVRMTLTEAGLGRVESIATDFFSYLALVRDQGMEDWRYEENARLAQIGFRFMENADPVSTVIGTSGTPGLIPFRDLLYHPYRYDSFNKKLLGEIIAQITPKRMLLTLRAKNLETDRKEKWYGTEFSIAKPSEKTLAEWEQAYAGKIVNPALKLKKPNPFIPRNVELIAGATEDERPKLIRDENGNAFWLMNDQRFSQPESKLVVRFEMPLAYHSPEFSAATRLLASIWKEQLNPLVYPASEAGYSFSVGFSDYGMTLNVSGYNENLPNLLERILKTTRNANVKPERFEAMKAELLQSWRNIEKSSAGQVLFYEMQYLLNDKRWHREEYIQTIPEIDAREVEMVGELIFQSMEVEAFLYGNADEELAGEIMKIMDSNLKFKPLYEGQRFNQRILDLENGKDFVLNKKLNDKDSAIIMFYEAEKQDLKQAMAGQVLSDLIGTPFFEQLRTREQLGYIVQSSFHNPGLLPSFFFYVQSPQKDPAHLQARIRSFLKDFQEKLKTMPPETFQSVIQAQSNRLKEEPKKSSEAFGEAWGAIRSKDFDFVSKETRLKILKNIKKEDVIAFYENLMLNPQNSEISIMGWGADFPDQKVKGTPIGKTSDFKRKATFFGHKTSGDLLKEY